MNITAPINHYKLFCFYLIPEVYCDDLNLTVSHGTAGVYRVTNPAHRDDLYLINTLVSVTCDNNTLILEANSIVCVDGLTEGSQPNWNASLPQCECKILAIQ